jgi:hypothetical protein
MLIEDGEGARRVLGRQKVQRGMLVKVVLRCDGAVLGQVRGKEKEDTGEVEREG